jgi:hypothetical protein
MDTEPAPVVPTSIIFLSIFWIILGTFIVSIFSRYLSAYDSYSWFGLIPFMIGIGLITMGWGLLTLQTWAYYSAVILSFLALIGSTISLAGMVVNWFMYLWYGADLGIILQEAFPVFFFLGFIAMIYYLFKNKYSFKKTSMITSH